ncbi:MAG: hypothetical protein ACXVPN_05845 [Bacteroidia bacterium]
MQSSFKGLMLIVFLSISGLLISQNDSVTTFDNLHYKLLNDYLQFADSMEKKPIMQSEFRIRRRKHVAIIDFNDGRHSYVMHKKIKIYKGGARYEKIRWFIMKGNSHNKLYVIKTIGSDYRYIEQYSYNSKLRKVKKIMCVDDNYIKIHTYRPSEERSVKNYLKHESSLPAAHQN